MPAHIGRRMSAIRMMAELNCEELDNMDAFRYHSRLEYARQNKCQGSFLSTKSGRQLLLQFYAKGMVSPFA